MKKMFLLVVVVLLLVFLFFIDPSVAGQNTSSSLPKVWAEEEKTKPITLALTSTQVPTSTPIPTFTATIVVNELPQLTPTAEPTATEIPPIVGYVIDGLDMGSGLPMAMAIYLPDGQVVGSTWAKAISYKGTDDVDVVFNPYAGTTFSMHDEVVSTFIHSGRISSVGDLFALYLEEYILGQIESPGKKADGMAAVESLRGAKVRLCQVEDPDQVALFSPFDYSLPCSGIEVDLEIVAAVLIERDNVDTFGSHVTGFLSWIREEYPDSGFEQIVSGTGSVVITCIGRFSDQERPEGDETPYYLFNRLVIGMRVVEEP